MRNRRGMFFPRACFQDLFHFRERKITLIFAIVEMRRDAHAGFGTIVDEDLPCEEFATNLVSMRALDRNRSRALGAILPTVPPPPATSPALHHPPHQPHS